MSGSISNLGQLGQIILSGSSLNSQIFNVNIKDLVDEISEIKGLMDDLNVNASEAILIARNAQKMVEDGLLNLTANTSDFSEVKEMAERAMGIASNIDIKISDINKEIGDLQAINENFNEEILEPFKDGIITETEALSIKKYLNTIEQNFGEVKTAFNYIKENEYLTVSAKNQLESYYNRVETEKTNLVNVINGVIPSGVTQDEVALVNAKFESYNNSLFDFRRELEIANTVIQTEIKNITENNMRAYSDEKVAVATEAAEIARNEAETAKLSAIEAKSYAESVNEAAENAIIEAEKAISRLDKMDDDSVITPSEKTSLKQQLTQINSDYNEINGNVTKYAEFYSDGEDKRIFEDYKTAYNKAKITLEYYTLDEVEDTNGELSKYIEIIVEEGNKYNFNNIAEYYEKRQLMYNSLCNVANKYSDKVSNIAKNEALEYAEAETLKVQALADAAQMSADQARQEAEDAINNAAKAQAQLDKMDDDNFISPVEKNSLIQQAAVISSDVDEVIEDLIEYEINSGETPAFISFIDAAEKALAAIEYHAQDVVIITDENGKQVETKHIPIQKSGDYNFGYINDYYPARQAMLNQISKITRKHAEKAAEDAKNEAMQLSDSKIDELQSTMVTIDNITDAINNKINDSFVDGIISEAESKAISLEVNNINSTFTQLQSQYDIIDNDNFILEQINNEVSLSDKPFTNAKTELKNAFDSLETCKNNLVNTITNVISDNVVSGEENESYQTAFTNFDNAIVLFNNKLKAVDDLVLSENLSITRTDLEQAYTNYVSAELASSSAATLAMADGKITDAEMRTIQSAQTIAHEAYTAAVEASESRISELGNKVDTAVDDLATANEKITEAKIAAQEAQTYATNIQKDLDLIGSDDYVTPSEKIILKKQLTEIGANHNEILINIELYKTNGIYKETGEDKELVDSYKETYRKAIEAIQFFTTTTVKNIPLSSYTQGSYSDIDDYYDKRQLMLNKITLWSDDYADIKAEEAKDAATTMLEESTSILNNKLEIYTKDLNDISALTESARSEAETALQKLDDIDNDSIITPSEKKVLDIQLNSIKSKYLEITDEARQYEFNNNADYLSYVECADEVIVTLETILVKDKWNENFNLTGDMVTKYNNISNYYTEEAKVLSSLTEVMQSYVDTTVDNLSTATNELIYQVSANAYSYASEIAEEKAQSAMENANQNLAEANKAIEDAKAAAAEAQKAAVEASKANEELVNFKSDKKITPPEKRNLAVLLKQIIEDKKKIESDCTLYNITDEVNNITDEVNNITLEEYNTSYDKSVDILDYILKDTEEFFDIDRTTSNGSKYSDIELYYEKRQALLDLISAKLNEKAETLASEAKASAIASATSMTKLLSATIDEVSGTANSMRDLLYEFDDDNVITINELPSLKFELSNIISRYNENCKYADLYKVKSSTEFNNYETAYNKAVSALTYHTSGVTSDKSTTIINTGDCSYGNISLYYDSELTLLEFIDGKAKSHVSEQANKAISEAKSYAEIKVGEINTQLSQNIDNINTNMQNNIASIKKNLDGDGIITVAEKKALIREWETLKGSSAINETIIGTTGNAGKLYEKANELKIDTNDLGLLTAICENISTYLSKIGLYSTGATTLTDADKNIANLINDEFINYYKIEAKINTLIAEAEAANAKTQAISDAEAKIATAKTALEETISDARDKAISAQTAANNAQTAASNAQTAASNAQTAANSAKSRLDDIDDDGKVTASEKKQLKTQLSQINANYKEITGTTGKYNITTGNNTTYKNYVTAYTAACSAFDSMELTSTATTSVNTSAFETINKYYDYESGIYNEISNKAKLHAESEANKASGAAKNYTDTIKESLSGTIDNIETQLKGKIESIDRGLSSSITELRDNFNDDNIITISEKKTLRREWGEIAGITSFTKDIRVSTGSAINVYNKLMGLSLNEDANDISNAYDSIRRVLSAISLYETGSTKLSDSTIDDKITTALTNYYQVEAKSLTKIAEVEAENAKNNAINSANSSLTAARNTLNANITTVSNNLASASGTLSSNIESASGKLNSSITAVNKSLTTATGALNSSITSVDTNLKSASGKLNTSITNVNKGLTAATGVLSTTTGTLQTATGNISTLQSNVSKLQEISGQLKSNIDNLNNNFNTDNIITVTEKKSLRIEWEKIAGVTNVSASTLVTNSLGSGNKIYTKLSGLGLSTTNLTNAFNNVRNSFSGIGLYTSANYTGNNASTYSNNIKSYLTKYYVAESDANIAIANKEAANAKSQAITSANSSLNTAKGELNTSITNVSNNLTTATGTLNTNITNVNSNLTTKITTTNNNLATVKTRADNSLPNSGFTPSTVQARTFSAGTTPTINNTLILPNAGIDGKSTSNNDIVFWGGSSYANKDYAPFKVYKDGSVYAKYLHGWFTTCDITSGNIDTFRHDDYSNRPGYFLDVIKTGTNIKLDSSIKNKNIIFVLPQGDDFIGNKLNIQNENKNNLFFLNLFYTNKKFIDSGKTGCVMYDNIYKVNAYDQYFQATGTTANKYAFVFCEEITNNNRILKIDQIYNSNTYYINTTVYNLYSQNEYCFKAKNINLGYNMFNIDDFKIFFNSCLNFTFCPLVHKHPSFSSSLNVMFPKPNFFNSTVENPSSNGVNTYTGELDNANIDGFYIKLENGATNYFGNEVDIKINHINMRCKTMYYNDSIEYSYNEYSEMFNDTTLIDSTITTAYTDSLTVIALTVITGVSAKVFTQMYFRKLLLFEGLYNILDDTNSIWINWMIKWIKNNSSNGLYDFVFLPKRDGEEIENIKIKHQIYYKGWKFI